MIFTVSGVSYFSFKMGLPGLVSQYGGYTFGHFLEITVITGTFYDMDHINLPEFVIRILEPCVPLYALFFRIERVSYSIRLMSGFSASRAIAWKLSDIRKGEV